MRTASLVCLLLVLVPESAAAQPAVQYGLRFDAQSSMQWAGADIFLARDDRVVVRTSLKNITDIWPGPAPGIFSVVSDEGIGILVGRDVVPGGHLLDANALLRSSRADTIWASIPGPGARIVEWRSSGMQREVFSGPERLIDFDVDRAGRLLVLTQVGLQLVVDAATTVRVPLPPDWPHGAERVFVNQDATEFAVLGGNSLTRFSVDSRRWVSTSFDRERQALVRHVQSRRVRIEPRFALR